MHRVAEILQDESRQKLKDDDNALIAFMWRQDLVAKKQNPDFMSASDFIELYLDGQLSNVETIRRARAKLQQEYPEMRGERYEERQGFQQQEMVEDLKSVSSSYDSKKEVDNIKSFLVPDKLNA